MRLKLFFFGIFSFFITSIVLIPNHIFAVTNCSDNIKPWLNPEIPDEVFPEIKNIIEHEQSQLPQRGHYPEIHFNESSPILNNLQESFLIEISKFKKDKGKKPVVAEIGPGLGHMTWKILAAGGLVNVIDENISITNQLLTRISAMNQSLWGNSLLHSIFTLYIESPLQLFENEYHDRTYDFIWVGNTLHHLSPSELKKMTAQLLRVLKPNGKIFFETISFPKKNIDIKNSKVLTKAYKKAVKNKLEFPGLFAINLAQIWDNSKQRFIFKTIVSVMNFQELSTVENDLVMQKYGEGYFHFDGRNSEALTLHNNLESVVQKSHETQRLDRNHVIINYIDKSSISKFFTQAGFLVKDIFYIDHKGKKIKKSEMSNLMGIIIQKPDIKIP